MEEGCPRFAPDNDACTHCTHCTHCNKTLLEHSERHAQEQLHLGRTLLP